MERVEVQVLGQIEKRVNGTVELSDIFLKKIGAIFLVESEILGVELAFHENEVVMKFNGECPTPDDVLNNIIYTYNYSTGLELSELERDVQICSLVNCNSQDIV